MKGIEEKDYSNFDYLSLTVKKESAEEVIASYGAFCWQETERKEDKQYHDVLHLTFKREHKINNKDRLQYLQVAFEALINERSQLKSRKHNKSNAVISTAGALFGCVLVGIIALVLYINSTLAIVLGSVMVAFEAALALAGIFTFRRLRKKERKVYSDRKEKLDKEINSMLAEAICLTGEKL